MFTIEDLISIEKKAISLFRSHWKGLAKTGSTSILSGQYPSLKREWLNTVGTDSDENVCFLCAYSDIRLIVSSNYEKRCICPIQWPKVLPVPNVDALPHCISSVYGSWELSESILERKRLSTIISNLPIGKSSLLFRAGYK